MNECEECGGVLHSLGGTHDLRCLHCETLHDPSGISYGFMERRLDISTVEGEKELGYRAKIARLEGQVADLTRVVDSLTRALNNR